MLGVVIALTGGCGGEGPRERVEAYIARVHALQRDGARDVRRANEVFRRLAAGDLEAADDIAEVEAAERSIHRARARLAGVRPPAEARRLHRSLLAAYDADAEVAADTTRLARYVPAMTKALAPMEGVGRRLERRLQRAGDPEAQARALARYASGLDGLLARLRRLEAPAVLFAVHQGQVLRLRSARDVARRLQGALTARDAERTARLVRAFRRIGASRSGSRLRRRSLQIYAERLKAVDVAAAAVQRERARLDRALG